MLLSTCHPERSEDLLFAVVGLRFFLHLVVADLQSLCDNSCSLRSLAFLFSPAPALPTLSSRPEQPATQILLRRSPCQEPGSYRLVSLCLCRRPPLPDSSEFLDAFDERWPKVVPQAQSFAQPEPLRSRFLRPHCSADSCPDSQDDPAPRCSPFLQHQCCNLIENKRLYQPLESTFTENRGREHRVHRSKKQFTKTTKRIKMATNGFNPPGRHSFS